MAADIVKTVDRPALCGVHARIPASPIDLVAYSGLSGLPDSVCAAAAAPAGRWHCWIGQYGCTYPCDSAKDRLYRSGDFFLSLGVQ